MKENTEIYGAEIDIRQLAQMYYGFGIMPWSFHWRNAFELKNQLEQAEGMVKRHIAQRFAV